MVSVIIPYNIDRGYLREAIASVENQTYKNFELLVQQSDNNCATNINSGLRRARGEFIKILAEDDQLTPDSLDTLVSHIGIYDFIYADAENFGELDGWPSRSHDSTVTLESMLKGNGINGGGAFYRRNALLEVGMYDETLWTAEEYDLHLKLIANGYTHKHVPAIVYRYRRHKANKSGNCRTERHELINKIRQRYENKKR